MRLRSLVPVFSVLSMSALSGCLQRPIGQEQPRTTNVLVDVLRRDTVSKIDLLFMIDNSRSMADKQLLFADALPDLVSGLVAPPCLTKEGTTLDVAASEPCPSGSAREFEPVQDIHIGVITSSLGGYTSRTDCVDDGAAHSEEGVDAAHLLGSLPRGMAIAPSAQDGFLAWKPKNDNSPLIDEFRSLVKAAGERGCGWEASLESWYRFLVDPEPYAELVRMPCNSSQTDELCIGPKLDAQTGLPLVDQEILAQRAAFLRSDSLLAIVMLTDENDCSFKAKGLTRSFSETRFGTDKTPAFQGTAACDDPAQGPNSACCHSCVTAPPEGCATGVNSKGNTVGAGCEEGSRFAYDDPDDMTNLRCFNQKERFGIDLLYPVERYSNALQFDNLCTLADDLNPQSERCAAGQGLKPNPLFAVDTASGETRSRNKSLVFLAGIVGVPWQDLAVSPSNDTTLVYRNNNPTATEDQRINWNWLLADRSVAGAKPQDALMIESVVPRTGMNPATGESLAPPEAGHMSNSINGHEWLVGDTQRTGGDLQYACTFPLAEPAKCLSDTELMNLTPEEAAEVPDCDCSEYSEDAYKNPLCQQADDSYGLEQARAKAYPGVRELQVLQDFGRNSVVASICPKTTDRNAADYGYRPAMAAIVERLKEGLVEKCFPRELEVSQERGVACKIVEARVKTTDDPGGCNSSKRKDVSAAVQDSVRRKLVTSKQCADEASCEQLELCEIEQLSPMTQAAELQSCLNDEVPEGDGWCYIDPAIGQGNHELVEKCPQESQRKVRFVGDGTPRPDTVTVFACSGATFAD